eukprot:jgi/Mesen1/10033/ME000073S09312
MCRAIFWKRTRVDDDEDAAKRRHKEPLARIFEDSHFRLSTVLCSDLQEEIGGAFAPPSFSIQLQHSWEPQGLPYVETLKQHTRSIAIGGPASSSGGRTLGSSGGPGTEGREEQLDQKLKEKETGGAGRLLESVSSLPLLVLSSHKTGILGEDEEPSPPAKEARANPNNPCVDPDLVEFNSFLHGLAAGGVCAQTAGLTPRPRDSHWEGLQRGTASRAADLTGGTSQAAGSRSEATEEAHTPTPSLQPSREPGQCSFLSRLQQQHLSNRRPSEAQAQAGPGGRLTTHGRARTYPYEVAGPEARAARRTALTSVAAASSGLFHKHNSRHAPPEEEELATLSLPQRQSKARARGRMTCQAALGGTNDAEHQAPVEPRDVAGAAAAGAGVGLEPSGQQVQVVAAAAAQGDRASSLRETGGKDSGHASPQERNALGSSELFAVPGTNTNTAGSLGLRRFEPSSGTSGMEVPKLGPEAGSPARWQGCNRGGIATGAEAPGGSEGVTGVISSQAAGPSQAAPSGRGKGGAAGREGGRFMKFWDGSAQELDEARRAMVETAVERVGGSKDGRRSVSPILGSSLRLPVPLVESNDSMPGGKPLGLALQLQDNEGHMLLAANAGSARGDHAGVGQEKPSQGRSLVEGRHQGQIRPGMYQKGLEFGAMGPPKGGSGEELGTQRSSEGEAEGRGEGGNSLGLYPYEVAGPEARAARRTALTSVAAASSGLFHKHNSRHAPPEEEELATLSLPQRQSKARARGRMTCQAALGGTNDAEHQAPVEPRDVAGAAAAGAGVGLEPSGQQVQVVAAAAAQGDRASSLRETGGKDSGHASPQERNALGSSELFAVPGTNTNTAGSLGLRRFEPSSGTSGMEVPKLGPEAGSPARWQGCNRGGIATGAEAPGGSEGVTGVISSQAAGPSQAAPSGRGKGGAAGREGGRFMKFWDGSAQELDEARRAMVETAVERVGGSKDGRRSVSPILGSSLRLPVPLVESNDSMPGGKPLGLALQLQDNEGHMLLAANAGSARGDHAGVGQEKPSQGRSLVEGRHQGQIRPGMYQKGLEFGAMGPPKGGSGEELGTQRSSEGEAEGRGEGGNSLGLSEQPSTSSSLSGRLDGGRSRPTPSVGKGTTEEEGDEEEGEEEKEAKRRRREKRREERRRNEKRRERSDRPRPPRRKTSSEGERGGGGGVGVGVGVARGPQQQQLGGGRGGVGGGGGAVAAAAPAEGGETQHQTTVDERGDAPAGGGDLSMGGQAGGHQHVDQRRLQTVFSNFQLSSPQQEGGLGGARTRAEEAAKAEGVAASGSTPAVVGTAAVGLPVLQTGSKGATSTMASGGGFGKTPPDTTPSGPATVADGSMRDRWIGRFMGSSAGQLAPRPGTREQLPAAKEPPHETAGDDSADGAEEQGGPTLSEHAASMAALRVWRLESAKCREELLREQQQQHQPSRPPRADGVPSSGHLAFSEAGYLALGAGAPGGAGFGGPLCPFCGLKGHTLAFCSETREHEMRSLRAEAAARQAGNELLASLAGQTPQQRQAQQAREDEHPYCLRCGDVGHWGSECLLTTTQAAVHARERAADRERTMQQHQQQPLPRGALAHQSQGGLAPEMEPPGPDLKTATAAAAALPAGGESWGGWAESSGDRDMLQAESSEAPVPAPGRKRAAAGHKGETREELVLPVQLPSAAAAAAAVAGLRGVAQAHLASGTGENEGVGSGGEGMEVDHSSGREGGNGWRESPREGLRRGAAQGDNEAVPEHELDPEPELEPAQPPTPGLATALLPPAAALLGPRGPAGGASANVESNTISGSKLASSPAQNGGGQAAAGGVPKGVPAVVLPEDVTGGKARAELTPAQRQAEMAELGIPAGMLGALESIRLSRRDLLKWVNSEELDARVGGFFLRLRFGKKQEGLGGSGYRMAQIQVGGPSSEAQGGLVVLVVDFGDGEYRVDSQCVSNKPFMESELVEWWKAVQRKGQPIITREEAEAKCRERRCWPD